MRRARLVRGVVSALGLALLAGGATAHAQTYGDGGTHVVSTNLGTGITLANGTTLEVTAGGFVRFVLATETTYGGRNTLRVVGGTVQAADTDSFARDGFRGIAPIDVRVDGGLLAGGHVTGNFGGSGVLGFAGGDVIVSAGTLRGGNAPSGFGGSGIDLRGPSHVTIANATLSGGSASSFAGEGLVLRQGGSVTIDGGTFSGGNGSSDYGGNALRVYGGTFDVVTRGGTFTGGSAAYPGRSVRLDGSGVWELRAGSYPSGAMVRGASALVRVFGSDLSLVAGLPAGTLLDGNPVPTFYDSQATFLLNPVSAESVVLAQPIAGVTTSATITFRTRQPWPSGGKLTLGLPGFTLDGVSVVSASMPGTFSVQSASGAALTLVRGGGAAVPADTLVTFTLAGVVTPSRAGLTAPVLFMLKDASDVPTDPGGLYGLSIAPRPFTSATIVFDEDRAGYSAEATITFTLGDTWVDGDEDEHEQHRGSLVLTLPGFDYVSGNVVSSSVPLERDWSAHGGTGEVALRRSGTREDVAAGTTVTVVVDGLYLPYGQTDLGPFVLDTRDYYDGVVINRATLSGFTSQCQPCSPGDVLDPGSCECMWCPACEAGTYEASSCSPSGPAICTSCSPCAPGSIATGGCDGVDDTVCTPCPDGTTGDGTHCDDDAVDACDETAAICGIGGGRVLWGVVELPGNTLRGFRCVVASANAPPVCDTLPDSNVLKTYDPMCAP